MLGVATGISGIFPLKIRQTAQQTSSDIATTKAQHSRGRIARCSLVQSYTLNVFQSVLDLQNS